MNVNNLFLFSFTFDIQLSNFIILFLFISLLYGTIPYF